MTHRPWTEESPRRGEQRNGRRAIDGDIGMTLNLIGRLAGLRVGRCRPDHALIQITDNRRSIRLDEAS